MTQRKSSLEKKQWKHVHHFKGRCSKHRFQRSLGTFEDLIPCVTLSHLAMMGGRAKEQGYQYRGVHALSANRRSGALLATDLAVQLDVFDEQRESDEAQILQGPNGVDLNSHLDVFYAILRQVVDTPQEISFLSLLQHLLRVDPKEAVSDVAWDTAETLVHRATLLESRQDATRLLRSPSQTKICCPCACHRGTVAEIAARKQSLGTPSSGAPLPPPPPPPPPGIPGPPPPPPPPPLGPSPPALPSSKMGGPPRPPPLLSAPAPTPSCSPEPLETNNKLLPQQETPTPRAKMKTINWNKIPNNKVVGKRNIWSLVATSHEHSPMADLDWAEMEGLFCQQAPPAPQSQASPRLGRDNSDPDRRRKESSEIVLLDGKRSLNVNIFLKQFRSSNDDIIQLIHDGEHDDIGAEKLRGLLKILPELDELEMLRTFNGDRSKLGNAEKFLLQLIQVPNYKLRIESMLLKEEFAANMGYLEPSINAMIMAGEDLMTNKHLQEVLYMVLVAGNFLNSGGYAGNAAGVKLSSLQKLTDIRANKPGMNLIHYVALQAEKKRKDLLRFPDEMPALEESTKTTVEQLQNEINTLDSRIKKIKKQIDMPSTEKDIKQQMEEFLQMAEQEVAALQHDMEELELVRKSLSEFFCEDAGTFKLEECLRVFHGFCTKFRQAVAENERRRAQEEQANARRRQREEQLANKRRQLSGGQLGPNSSESDSNLMDSLLYDARSGLAQGKIIEKDYKGRKFQNGGGMTSEEDISITSSPLVTRRRMGSFSGPTGDQTASKDEGYSPDVTPNGSLRRRRSRVLSEEDDSNLMDFLRSSGHDNTRERKSWGSLDRSWARRARGGGSRKRPELLSVDFSGERERPSSPSPLAENKPILPAATEAEKPRAWRQKIEAWLQENEKEEKQSDDLRRRSRRVQNRRSLEADSESEGRGSTLDTLPEEKATPPTSQYKRVYSDWKPTIEKTDVVGAMEAIEEAQPHTPVKDKSPWRKSNLNVPNSTEGTEVDVRKLRRMRSRGSIDGSQATNILQSIKEEDKRKGILSSLAKSSPSQDRLILYLRQPSGAPEPPEDKPESPPVSRQQTRPRSLELSDPGSASLPSSPLMLMLKVFIALNTCKYRHSMDVAGEFIKSIVGDKETQEEEQQTLPPSVPRRLRKHREDSGISDRVEIDSDNIETPPATRRAFGDGRGGTHSMDEGGYTRRPVSQRSVLAEGRSQPGSPDVSRSRRFIGEERKSVEREEPSRVGHRTREGEEKTGGDKTTRKLREEEEVLGDGQFDRFSSARRTRRYKKNVDSSDKESGHGDEVSPTRRMEVVSPELVSEKQVIRPSAVALKAQSYSVTSAPLKVEDTESRLRKWQDRLRYRGGKGDGSDMVTEEAVKHINSAGEELQNLAKVTSRASSRLKADEDNVEETKLEQLSTGTDGRGSSSHRNRVRSMIDPKQVEEALKQKIVDRERGATQNRSFISRSRHQPIIESSPVTVTANAEEKRFDDRERRSRQKSEFIPEIKVQASTPSHIKTNRSEHDLNDEGFEETQSLVSETPSQGTSSGCNYEGDVTDSAKKSGDNVKRRPGRLIRADSSGSGDTSSSTNPPQLSPPPTATNISLHESLLKPTSRRSVTPKTESIIERSKILQPRRSALERSSSVKTPGRSGSRDTEESGARRSGLVHRSASLRKTDSQTSVCSKASNGPVQKRRSVERSNSRTSLRSSRSSLNSSTSVNTVKNVPPPLSKSSSRSSVGSASRGSGRLSGYTSAIKALTTNLSKDPAVSRQAKFGYQSQSKPVSKRPLAPVQLKSSTSQHKSVPASRSSSSGSSIGPTVRRPRVTTGISTSFKENAVSSVGVASGSSVPASRSSSSGSSIGPTARRPKLDASTKEISTMPSRLPSHRGMSFMRPTAASSAKDSKDVVDMTPIKVRSAIRVAK
uniref:FH2 domain-containing protein n=1 Tax=Timema monikensis TaxID=170555 RepID=A0A7R9HKL9_9NEOP|nr:unnamed protein product [Timema monikensis]